MTFPSFTALRSLFGTRRPVTAGAGDAPRPDPPNPAYLQPGTMIGAYEVAGLAGYGGFGFLYRVTRDSKPYALKISKWRARDLDPEERVDNEKRLDREISALMSFRHRNIVRVHGFERWPSLEDGYPYLVMDFVEGDHLNEWRKKTAPTLRTACEVAAAIADALGYIHRCGVFHRDLKSENVLVRRSDGSPIIVDFGISRLREADPVTRVGYTLGTITHYAPEYAEFVTSFRFEQGGTFEWRPETDLHAFGYVLYELLTGHAPFPRASRAMRETPVLHMIRKHVPAPPSVRSGGLVPASLDGIVMRLLAKNPDDRFSSGDEVALAIRRAAREGGPAWDAPMAPPREDLSSAPTPRWSRPPSDVAHGKPAPFAATPAVSRPAPAAAPAEAGRDDEHEIVDLDSEAVESQAGDGPGVAPAEGARAAAHGIGRGLDRLVPAALRRAELPMILLGIGALLMVGMGAYAIAARTSQHGQPGEIAALAAGEGARAAQAPAPHPASQAAAPLDASADRRRQDSPAAKGSRAPERPAVADARAHADRLEREARLARARDAQDAARRERVAREAGAREAAATEAAAREEAEGRERAAKEAALAESRRPAPGLGQDEIQAAVSSARESFERCLRSEKENASWSPFSSRKNVKLDGRRVALRINVQPDGKVTYPTFDDVTLKGTDLGSCLVDVTRGMKFRPFDGKAQQVDIPLVLHK